VCDDHVVVEEGAGSFGLDEALLVVLVGASGSGKSTWAGERFRASEVVSSDHLRGVVGLGPHDLGATDDAFAALDLIVSARLSRKLTTVVDTLGLDAARRRQVLDAARRAGLTAIAVVFHTDASLCRARNRERAFPVPAPALTSQLRRMRDVPTELTAEGWDRVVTVTTSAAPAAVSDDRRDETAASPAGLEFVLQLSRFGWDDDPAGWLRSVAEAAMSAGFGGIALMDHLIQIPQVGRAWDPIPEPWVTLGLLAGLPTSLRLGTLVSPASAHLAGRLAKQAATLDVLTGGRAFCGVGAGWWEREHAAFGIPFAPGGQRVADLERCIETMRALWSPGTKAFEGERVSLPETTCYPRPVGDLPIVVGGRGARVLDVAARLGDACNVPPAYVEQARSAMAGKPVTVLDVPVLGTDREHAAPIVERVRGRTSAATFARTRGAGTAPDLVARYERMVRQGVSTVFVAPADFTGPDDLARWRPVLTAFTPP
jgi:alkanesulfonate monooxygenase SsuD/methylene tetrahydromethanopterin reductase-like flavin-dependent oxidoreductase (luciferase family)/predicted kinase